MPESVVFKSERRFDALVDAVRLLTAAGFSVADDDGASPMLVRYGEQSVPQWRFARAADVESSDGLLKPLWSCAGPACLKLFPRSPEARAGFERLRRAMEI